MKKKLFIPFILGILFLSMPSFSLIKVKSASKRHIDLKIVKPTCTADIASFTVNSISSSSITVTWTYSGSPSSFNYGGYYNNYGSPGTTIISTVNTTSTTVTIPIPSQSYGIRIGVACVCSDGSVVGHTHGVYCEYGRVVNYF